MDLPAFIRNLGVDKAAQLFDEKPRTVMGWMYGERRPRPKTAQKIVERTRNHPAGRITLNSIYGDRPQ